MCYVPRLQAVVTVDAYAIRLWSFRKQVKVVHWPKNINIKKQKFHEFVYIEHIDCVFILVEKREASGHKSMVIQLWHPEKLCLITEVDPIY